MQQQVPHSGGQMPPVSAKPDRWSRFRGLSWWQVTLAVLPMLLVPIGGLIGGLIGALAMVLNLSIARQRIPALVKALVMLAVVLVSFAVWATIINLLVG